MSRHGDGMVRPPQRDRLKTTRSVACDYCRRPAELVTGDQVYPHRSDLRARLYWRCTPCGAFVGCHVGRGHEPDEPLGRLANKELRELKAKAHAAFDWIWKGGAMTRTEAYTWLAEQLGIDKARCHIGHFDAATCRRVIEICAGRKR